MSPIDWVGSPKFTAGHPAPLIALVHHRMVGTLRSTDAVFTSTDGREASTNFGIGYGFCAAMVKGFESELFRIPLIISLQTMGYAAGITFLAAVISGLSVLWQIEHLDLIGVLKSKE